MVDDLVGDAFAELPDAAAIVDTSGAIVAVNTAWTDRARDGGDAGGCGVGTDYVAVCRAGVRGSAPGAGRAYVDVTTVLGGRRPRASSVYPCSTPRGLRWYRGDVFALGGGRGVCVRHLDLTDVSPRLGRLDRIEPAVPRRHPQDGDSFHGGLAELLGSDVAHEHLVVLIGGVTGTGRELAHATLVAQLAIERAVSGATPDSAGRVELVARLGGAEIAVAVSAPTLAAAMATADGIRAAASGRLPHCLAWGLAVTGHGQDDARAVVRRARRAVRDARAELELDPTAPGFGTDGTHELHRCAARLADAVAEFDTAIELGLPMPDLRLRDQEVVAAEQACLLAAEALSIRH